MWIILDKIHQAEVHQVFVRANNQSRAIEKMVKYFPYFVAQVVQDSVGNGSDPCLADDYNCDEIDKKFCEQHFKELVNSIPYTYNFGTTQVTAGKDVKCRPSIIVVA